jgi:hypothetical protein
MANIMTTYVKIKNLDEETHKKLVDLYETNNESFDVLDILRHFNKLYDRNFNDTDNFYGVAFMNDNVGSKWLSIEFGCWSTEEFKQYSDTVDLVLESAWNVPTLYLEKLTEVLTEINKDVVVYGTYEDESWEPMGAFVYAYDYDDIEDYDEEVEVEDMLQDEDYRYEVMNDLREHRDAMYEAYLEVKAERKEDENDS